jgi:hypothetical protein
MLLPSPVPDAWQYRDGHGDPAMLKGIVERDA